MRNLIEEVELADQLGLDVFGIGEHHRPDLIVSAPAVRAGGGGRTDRAHPADERRHGAQLRRPRARVPGLRDASTCSRAGAPRSWPDAARSPNRSRSSASTSRDYDDLFEEKLKMLIALRGGDRVQWSGEAPRTPRWAQPCVPAVSDATRSPPASAWRRSARRSRAPSRGVMMSGSMPACSYAHSRPVRPTPGLDLVEDEERARLVAQLAQPGQIVVVGDVHAALALDAPRRGSPPSRPSTARSIARRSLYGTCLNPGTSGSKPCWYFSWPVARDRGERPAVERVARGDDLVAVVRPARLRVLPRELDGRLVRLRARVAEEHALRERVLAEQLGEVDLRRGVIEVRHVQQRRRRLLDGAGHARMAVPERR